MNKKLKEEIKKTIETSIRNYFIKKMKKGINTSHVLDPIFPVERRIRSLIGGLETSLGTTLWEPLAKTLAKNNGFEILDEKILQPKPMPMNMLKEISMIRSERENKNSWIDIQKCQNRLLKIAKEKKSEVSEFVKAPSGSGVDIFLKKDNKYFAYDIKTTQPNDGSFKRYNIQIIDWYAYTYLRYPERKFTAQIAFPFNPHKKNFWDAIGNKVFPLEKKVDALVEDEFWDKISGLNGTFSHILDIFKELGENDFRNEFSDIFYKEN